MGTTAPALLIAAVALASPAHADPCTGVTASGGRFATCFDLGNRLSVTAGTDGVGASVKLRHLVRFDDEPDLVWKLEHTIADATYGGWQNQLDGALYRGRFLRHARDGHIVLPFGIPRKVFLPFDIGADAEVGTLRWRPLAPAEEQLQVGVVQIAGLMDFARTRSFGRRFAIGPVVRWDIDVDRSMGRIGKVSEHTVVPFSTALLDIHFESKDGLYNGGIRAEAGTAWHTRGGWQAEAKAEATLERIVIAINDRPIALVAGLGYATTNDEAVARIGARVVLVHRNDKRVNLRPLQDRAVPAKPTPAAKPPAPITPPAAQPAPPVAPPAPPSPAEPTPTEPPASDEPPATPEPPASSEPAPADGGGESAALTNVPPAWRI